MDRLAHVNQSFDLYGVDTKNILGGRGGGANLEFFNVGKIVLRMVRGKVGVVDQ